MHPENRRRSKEDDGKGTGQKKCHDASRQFLSNNFTTRGHDNFRQLCDMSVSLFKWQNSSYETSWNHHDKLPISCTLRRAAWQAHAECAPRIGQADLGNTPCSLPTSPGEPQWAHEWLVGSSSARWRCSQSGVQDNFNLRLNSTDLDVGRPLSAIPLVTFTHRGKHSVCSFKRPAVLALEGQRCRSSSVRCRMLLVFLWPVWSLRAQNS